MIKILLVLWGLFLLFLLGANAYVYMLTGSGFNLGAGCRVGRACVPCENDAQLLAGHVVTIPRPRSLPLGHTG